MDPVPEDEIPETITPRPALDSRPAEGATASDGEHTSHNSIVFCLKNQVGGLAKALHVFKV